MVYVRQEKLPALKEYKYSGVDHSLLSRYVLKPFYTNFVIKCFPMSMAPNLITLSGFSFIIANVLTLLWYTPTLDQDCPPWVYFSWSIGLFLYQTFDAVDGSQARRTHQSGPLGELFDHGVDALNTSLEVLVFAASQNFGMGWKTVLVLFGSLLTFYVQTWDEYHTKTLTLGIVSGPVEGIVILTLVYAFTGFMGGGSFWQQSMLQTLGVPHFAFIPDIIYNLAFNEWYLLQGGSVLVFNTIQSYEPLSSPTVDNEVLLTLYYRSLNVISARRKRGDRSRGALLGLLPFFGTWTLIPAYLYLNPEILYNHLVPFVVFAGLVNAYSVGQMITAHLVKLDFPYYNVLVLPLAYGVFDSLGPFLQTHIGVGWPSALGDGGYQVAYMFSMLGMAIGVYGSFVVDVIVTICDYLDIWCLMIKHPWDEEAEAKKAKKAK
ncbi:hypothetical protein HYALB_00001451 [Hymenoscyphus albidus]|uniref:diacylglycerol cholinephosphotransferase n=1 Tax=Hymenoscyphus albidus TaxID=595503 RepID=A0A9N9L9U0_9HELO|nr:hypothetical protein HYALB_00001451 [Hymenoscyphus albidus]